MLQTEKALVFVSATRIKGISNKGNPYDFGHVEVSDGIGSLEWPVVPEIVETVNSTFNRGDKVKLYVDARKSFGKTEFVVTKVEKS